MQAFLFIFSVFDVLEMMMPTLTNIQFPQHPLSQLSKFQTIPILEKEKINWAKYDKYIVCYRALGKGQILIICQHTFLHSPLKIKNSWKWTDLWGSCSD